MKNHFIYHKKADFSKDNDQNIVFEMVALCIADGTRIIIEQETKRGNRYIMVDFQPTDKSNEEAPADGKNVCFASSVDGDDEGDVGECFTNYLDACRWLADFIRKGDFTEMYIETY